MKTVIEVENLSKYYRLGTIGGGTLSGDLSRLLAKIRGNPDPLLKIGESEHGNRKDDQIWALKDVSFKVEQGEILGIIGGNGAGKSTLLKILSRITAPTHGKITLQGRVGSLLEVGTGFHPELTGRENIYLNGTILGMKKTEVDRRLDEIIEFAEMNKFIDTPVKRYSSGMTVRLAFAVAAHLEPEILIVDEVLAVGDVEFQKKCIGKMRDVSKGGRTVLFVSHNLGVIGNLCDTGLVISNGEVISEKSSIEKAINLYLNQKKDSIQADLPYVKRWESVKDGLELSSLSIAGSDSGKINLDSVDGRVLFGFCFNYAGSIFCELELRLYDQNGAYLGFSSPWRFGGNAAIIKGESKCEWLINFPAFKKGVYEAEILLTVPNKEVVGRVAGRIVFETEGKIRGKPAYFYHTDVGSLLIEGALVES